MAEDRKNTQAKKAAFADRQGRALVELIFSPHERRASSDTRELACRSKCCHSLVHCSDRCVRFFGDWRPLDAGHGNGYTRARLEKASGFRYAGNGQ